MRHNDVLLLDMLTAARNIRAFVDGLKAGEFDQSQLHQSAVLRELQVIGEAARMMSETAKQQYSQINWHQIAGMRNRVIHQYFRIDLEIVWDIVEKDIPALITQLEALIPRDPSDPD
jgi:uncharacterized protein with HEPN domain